MIFQNRVHAGNLLAQQLVKYRNENLALLALPRGGVPVAKIISEALNVPLNVLIVRKIGAPLHEELAVGALCENEEPIWNESLLFQLGLEPRNLSQTIQRERKKIRDQVIRFRGASPLPSMTQKTVIIVDDGLATGATMHAAIKYLKKTGASKIVCAVPVAPTKIIRELKNLVEDTVVLNITDNFASVGKWYEDFSQVTDEEVINLLNKKFNNRGFEERVGK